MIRLLDALYEAAEAGNDFQYDPDKLQAILAYLSRSQNYPSHDLNGGSKPLSDREQATLYRREILQLGDILDSIPANIFWKDVNNRYMGVNKGCLKLTSFEHKNELIGKRLSEIFPDNEAIRLIEEVDAEIMARGTTYNQEEEAVDQYGNFAVYYTIKHPLYEGSKVVGMVGVSIDITDRRQLEEDLKRSNAVKDEFIRNMSHDIRTPITGMLGLIDEIKEAPMSADNDVKARLLEQATKSLLDFSNEILETIVWDDPGSFKQEPFNLLELISENIKRLSANIRVKGIQVGVECNADPTILWGHKMVIDRVLLNLISNAVKFTDQGEIQIKVLAQSVEGSPEERHFVVEIHDTGVGIPKEKHAYIFEKFSRVKSAYSSDTHGSGLGLYMVRNLLRKIGGSIDVQSEPNVGSVFTITFNAKEVEVNQLI